MSVSEVDFKFKSTMGDSFYEFGPVNGVEHILPCDISTPDQTQQFAFSRHFHEDSGYASKINGFDVDGLDNDAHENNAMTSAKPQQNGQRNGVLKRGHRDSKNHHVTFSDEPEIVTSEAMTSSMQSWQQTTHAPAASSGHFSILQLGEDGFPAYDVIAPVGVEGVVQTQRVTRAVPSKSVFTAIIDSPSPSLHAPAPRDHARVTNTASNGDVITPRQVLVTPIIRLKRWPR